MYNNYLLYIVIGLAGNKCDLIFDECVNRNEVKDYAKEQKLDVFFISAQSGDGIDDMFMSLVNKYNTSLNKTAKKNKGGFQLDQKETKKKCC